MNRINLFASILVVFLFSSCSDNKNNSYLSVGITDAPVDNAVNINVQFDSIEFKPSNGSAILVELDTVRTIDLMALSGSNFELLVDNLEVQAGEYQWMRLGVNAERGVMDSSINLIGGETFSLYIPSGSQSGLKINKGFVVPVGGAVSLMVDFDLRQSVTNPVGLVDDYILRPTLRMTDNSQTGTIQGSVSASAVSGESCNEGKAIYLYSGADVTADDLGSDTPPLTTTMVNYNADTDRWDFEIGFVEAGDYTIALTCDADIDVLETDEASWGVIASMNTLVVSGETVQVDFD
ncbi:MAG: DUF4382 domain-containing protein [Gammaproteobacteria bacterium]|nr:DUF4382 domain-containing protein [Gammaproteobacteria bacterium]MDH5630486.1 DUF4382 domain-containing protein [Gammaproteobacteria bacterium]